MQNVKCKSECRGDLSAAFTFTFIIEILHLKFFTVFP